MSRQHERQDAPLRSPRAEILISGLGAVSPLGVGVSRFVRGLREGRSGVRALRSDMPGLERIRSRAGAVCADFDPTSVMSAADASRLPRLVPMALAAAREAVERAGLGELLVGRIDRSRRVGLILGTGAGGIDFTLDQAAVGYNAPDVGTAEGYRRGISLWTITNATHGNLAGELSIRLGLHGPSWCVSTGCASSSDAIGLAIESLRSDRAGAPDAMVVVGADAHVRWETLAGMELLKVISTRTPDESARDPRDRDPSTFSRPFDRTRDGFVLGEGAWALVLEREPFARERGIGGFARAVGYGATCDAFHKVRPAPDMAESARAMTLAMEDAGMTPRDIAVIHYHGTATAMNDALETQAVKLAFADHARRLVGHSVKGAIGHPQGACGAAACVATLGAMLGLDGGEPFLPPTVNLEEPDLEAGCDLDYTPLRPRPRGEARAAMINCLAFGAKNSALVLEVLSC